MREGFYFPVNQSIWLPLGTTGTQSRRDEGMQFSVVGRLREGVGLDEANVQISAIAQANLGRPSQNSTRSSIPISPFRFGAMSGETLSVAA